MFSSTKPSAEIVIVSKSVKTVVYVLMSNTDIEHRILGHALGSPQHIGDMFFTEASMEHMVNGESNNDCINDSKIDESDIYRPVNLAHTCDKIAKH